MNHHNELSTQLVTAGYNAFVAHCAMVAAKSKANASWKKHYDAAYNLTKPALYPITREEKEKDVAALKLQSIYDNSVLNDAECKFYKTLFEYDAVLSLFNTEDNDKFSQMPDEDKAYIGKLRDDFFYTFRQHGLLKNQPPQYAKW